MGSMKIIGITGRARSGKDTMADMIVALSKSGIRMSFADPIRYFVSQITGVSYADLVDSPRKEEPIPELGNKSPRQMMQTLGTEWGRELIDNDLWIKVARRSLDETSRLEDSSRPDLVVFSDVRFENEAAMIRSTGGTIIHVERPGTEAVSAHASELGVVHRGEDWRFVNSSSLGFMRKFLADLIG